MVTLGELLLSSILVLSFCLRVTMGQEDITVRDLCHLSIIARDSEAQQRAVQEKFPLREKRISQWLARVAAQPMDHGECGGLTIILYSHGAEGFLWGMNQLSRDDTIWIRKNIMTALRFHTCRELYVMYIAFLADRRDIPEVAKVWHGELPLPKRPPYGPMRICDSAFSLMCHDLYGQGQLPQELEGNRMCARTVMISERDRCITILKKWWDTKGERLITETKPSVIDAIVKQGLKDVDDTKGKDGKKD